MTEFFLAELPNPCTEYTAAPDSGRWDTWLACILGTDIDATVRRHLRSNLKHILCGLEMKAGLLLPHFCQPPMRPTLFESYAQIMTLEFCYGTYSVCEGLGALFHRQIGGGNGSGANRVSRDDCLNAINVRLAGVGEVGTAEFGSVGRVRDFLHQDKVSGRDNIDWHSLGYTSALLPALTVLQALFRLCPERVPADTILTKQDWAAVYRMRQRR